MKVKLLKSHKVGLKEKPEGLVLEVTRKFGQQLIHDQVAEAYTEKKKAVRPKKAEQKDKPKNS